MKPKTISTENLADATAQEVFNHVAHHLLTQNVKAGEKVDWSFVCLYKDGRNNKCAAGCLIPDELYTKEMEDRPWFSTGENSLGKRGMCQEFGFPDNHSGLINNLQEVHDAYSPAGWKDRLSNVAVLNGLSYKVVEEIE